MADDLVSGVMSFDCRTWSGFVSLGRPACGPSRSSSIQRPGGTTRRVYRDATPCVGGPATPTGTWPTKAGACARLSSSRAGQKAPGRLCLWGRPGFNVLSRLPSRTLERKMATPAGLCVPTGGPCAGATPLTNRSTPATIQTTHAVSFVSSNATFRGK
jgi:hypothetical protein